MGSMLPNGVLTSVISESGDPVYGGAPCQVIVSCSNQGLQHSCCSQFRVIQPLPEATSEGIGIELSMRATYLLTQDTPLLIHVTLTMRLHHVRS